jgi:hypothetical protein
MRKVVFRLEKRPDYLPYFLEAVLQNPMITDLSIWTNEEYEGPLEIGPFIQSKHKVLVSRVLPGDLFHEALRANQAIEELSLSFRAGTSHEADLIVRSVSNHQLHPDLCCFWLFTAGRRELLSLSPVGAALEGSTRKQTGKRCTG